MQDYKDIPLYKHGGAYARENGELPAYRDSHTANLACKDALEFAISDNYSDNHLNRQGIIDTMLKRFSIERIKFVLAMTVMAREYDGRISRDNKKWAWRLDITPNPDGIGFDRNIYYALDKAHSVLVDGLITYFRQQYG